MNIDHLKASLSAINDCCSKLLLTSNYCRLGDCLTWNNYKSGIYNKILYAKEYEMLIENRQYSFLLLDKSFLQFYYEFKEGVLLKAKLCYYPFPISNREDSEQLEEYFCESGTDLLDTYYYGLRELSAIGIVSSNNSHFRLDYDASVETHAKAHAQYSGVNDLRVPLNYLLDPMLFFDFIVSALISDETAVTLMQSKRYKTVLDVSKSMVMKVSEEKGLHLSYC